MASGSILFKLPYRSVSWTPILKWNKNDAQLTYESLNSNAYIIGNRFLCLSARFNITNLNGSPASSNLFISAPSGTTFANMGVVAGRYYPVDITKQLFVRVQDGGWLNVVSTLGGNYSVSDIVKGYQGFYGYFLLSN